MAPNFIEFDGRQRRRTGGYYITLNGKGEFLINRPLFDGMEQPEAVLFYFDPDTDTIGMRKADLRQPNSFAIRLNNPSGTRIIRARIFTTKWDIRLDGTFCFPDPQIENGMLLLPLNTRLNVSRPRRP